MDPTHIPKLFGHRLRLARTRASLSQAGLAERLGVGQDTISHYEKGRSQPNIVMTYHLAKILAVDVNYFFQLDPPVVDADTFALMPSLPTTSYQYIVQFIEQAARNQQLHQYFQREFQRDTQQCIKQALEREVRDLESLKLKNKHDILCQGMAHFSLILVYLAQLERSAVSDDLLKRIWKQGKRFMQFIYEWQEVSA